MNIRNKLKDFKARLSDRHMYSIVLVVTAVIAGFGIYQYKRSIDFRNQIENGYQRAFTELVDYVNNLDTTLSKAMVSNTPSQLSALAADLWRHAAFAQANLGQLPVANTQLDNTANFLSQVGDYTYSLSKKVARGETLSQKEVDQLNELGQYASSLNQNLQDMENQMFAGVLRFNQFKNIGSRMFGNDKQSFDGSMNNIESSFSDYASLIYDGPFSEHVLNKEPVMTKNAPEITQDEAKTKVIDFLGSDKVQSVEVTGEGAGHITTYTCNAITNDDKREIYVEVTKNGGYIMSVLDNKNPENSQLDINAASLKARDFLSSRGFQSMHESYYQREGNSVIINYAFKQGDFVMYTDLIKVEISLENGDMIGFEAAGYLTNHVDKRTLPKILVSEQQARSKVRKDVQISGINFTYIPLESGQNIYCYEVKGTLNSKNYLVYINVENGREEKILQLIENEDGILTI